MTDKEVTVHLMPLSEKPGTWGMYIESANRTLVAVFRFKPMESFSWIQPLSEDRTKYFLTHRNIAVKMEGSYVYDGAKYECNDDCLMGEDSIRASMSYPVDYWQAQIQTTLKDGRTFGIFLGDGVASHMPTKSTSEDFLKLDGKVIKLDMTRLTEEDITDVLTPRSF